MAITTTVPFRRLVGKLIRGVADGSSGAPRGIPLAEAQVTFDALIDSAVKGELVIFDTIQAVTDTNAVLRNPETNEPGVWLVPTNDPTVGATGWTWHVTVSTPSSGILYEFDMIVPSGAEDLDLKDVMPVPGNIGQAVLDWEQAVLETAANAADALSYRNTALSYRDQTNTHRANAVTAQNNAYGARDAALASATAAALSASMVQDAVMRAPSMIFNGGFELGTGAAATGWTLAAANADRVAANAYRGSASMLLPQSGNVSEIMSDAAPTEGNRWVRLSAMYRTSSDSASLGGPRIQYSSNGTTWTQLGASPAFPHSAAWASFEIRRQIPVGALFVRARIAAAANSPTIRVDEVRLDDITELVAAETAAAAANTAYQSSTASLAITGNTVTATRVNGTTYSLGALGPAGEYTDNLVPDAEFGMELWSRRSGAVSASTYVTTTGLPGKSWKLDGVGTEVSVQSADFQVQGGEQYRLSVSMQNKLTPAGQPAHVRIQWLTETKANISTEPYLSLGDTTWSEQTAVRTAPATARYARFLAIHANTATGGNFWFGKPRVRRMLNAIQDVPSNQVRAIEERRGRVAVFTGSSNVLTGGWSTLLSAAMGWTEKNYAVGGTGFAQGDNGTPTGPNTFQKQLTTAATDPSIVNSDVGYVFIGDAGNDSLSAQTAVAIGTAADSAIAFAQAQFPNARVVLVPMLWGPHAWHDTGAAWIKMLDVVEQLRRVSTERKIDFTEDSWLWHHNDASSMLSGEVHFTAGGHAIIRDRVAQHLRTGSSTPIREWNMVGAASANITVAPDSGGDYRGLSVKRVGGEVSLQGRMVTSVIANNATWAVVPNGFRPTYAQEVHCRIGTLSTVGVISKNGNITVYANASAGATVTFGATYRVD